jgi:iron complex transport system ATP-binding protein
MTGGLRCAYVPGSSARLFGERLWSLEDLRGRVGILMPEQVRLFHRHELAGDVVLSTFRAAIGITAHMDFTEEEKERTAEVIAQVGLDDLAGRLFCTLSSGGKRRFLLARALVHRPEALVLDEAMTALDLPSAWGLMHTVRALSNAGTGLVMVTHDYALARRCSRCLRLADGHLEAFDPDAEQEAR